MIRAMRAAPYLFVLPALLLLGCAKPDRQDPPAERAERAMPDLDESERRAALAGKILKQLLGGDLTPGQRSPLPPEFAADGAGAPYTEVHIFDIQNRPDGFSTTAHIEAKAAFPSGRRIALVDEITAEWAVAEDGEVRLKSWQRTGSASFVESPAPWFTDHTERVIGATSAFREHLARGLDHWLTRVEAAHGIDPFIRNGLALGDADGDGRDDLYVCQPGGLPNRLFLHQADDTLREAPAGSGTALLDHTSAALFIDLDNDGDQDLALASPVGIVLLENTGQAKFEPRGTLKTDAADCYSLSAADYDLDGHLDLFITFAMGGREGGFLFHDARDGGANQLFKGDGGWAFSEVTDLSGLGEDNDRHSLAAVWHDYDLDGDPDLYVANDYGANQLYRNDLEESGRRRFRAVTAELGVRDVGAGMSASWADYDRDGLPDLYVGNMFSNAGRRITAQAGFLAGATDEVAAAYRRFAKGNTLFRQKPDGQFEERRGVAEMGRWAWSSVFADLDNDGWQDLFVANGYISGPEEEDL